ncbi:MAG: VPLPA-CTERM sorting domain-containing protein [Dinoroseobacter sp.]|nr:VPLPA-CTERM sorting domain-containing protein [Dinoroseobacter sp.]
MIKVSLCAAACVLMATVSSAAVVQSSVGVVEGAGLALVDDSSGFAGFAWDTDQGGVYAASAAFQTDRPFDLTFVDYRDGGGGPVGPDIRRLSGFVLETTNGFDGTTTNTLTTRNPSCGQSAYTLITYESCNEVAAAGYTGPSTGPVSRPGDVLFTNLPAGNYRMKFLEGGVPASGEALFQVTDAAVIPLPATFPLVLAGLGALGFVSRKRKPAA